MSQIETLFDLGGTVQKWNSRFMEGSPSTLSEVSDLGRDVIRMIAVLGKVPVKEVVCEEITWKDRIGYIGLDFTQNPEGEFWALIPSESGFVDAEQDMSPRELAEFVWKGFLLSHRTSPALRVYQESIRALIGQVAWPDNTHLLN